MLVKLNTQEDVAAFVESAVRMKSKVRIHALNSIVNASSIMGILTLNLSESIALTCEDEEEAKEALEQFIVEE